MSMGRQRVASVPAARRCFRVVALGLLAVTACGSDGEPAIVSRDDEMPAPASSGNEQTMSLPRCIANDVQVQGDGAYADALRGNLQLSMPSAWRANVEVPADCTTSDCLRWVVENAEGTQRVESLPAKMAVVNSGLPPARGSHQASVAWWPLRDLLDVRYPGMSDDSVTLSTPRHDNGAFKSLLAQFHHQTGGVTWRSSVEVRVEHVCGISMHDPAGRPLMGGTIDHYRLLPIVMRMSPTDANVAELDRLADALVSGRGIAACPDPAGMPLPREPIPRACTP